MKYLLFASAVIVTVGGAAHTARLLSARPAAACMTSDCD